MLAVWRLSEAAIRFNRTSEMIKAD